MDNVGRPGQPYLGLAIPSKQTLFSWLLGKKQGRLQEGRLWEGRKARLQEGRNATARKEG